MPRDKRALEILFGTYWSPSGWNPKPHVSAEDFAYAKSRRIMFDPIRPTHDEAVARLHAARDCLDLRRVADGFLASLSTRRPEWRSALGSFSVSRWLPTHEAMVVERYCGVCGLYEDTHAEDQDLNVLNFERLKWGGVRHADPIYAALDLEMFSASPPPAPTADDVRIVRELVAAIVSASPSVTSAALHAHFPASLKSNKSERDMIVAILGLCGILGTPRHPGFGERFVPSNQRVLPNRHYVDMAYPACWWRRSDGVNDDRLRAVFGHVL